jgi:hypothetical protein
MPMTMKEVEEQINAAIDRAIDNVMTAERQRPAAIRAEAQRLGLVEYGERLVNDPAMTASQAISALKDAKIKALETGQPWRPEPTAQEKAADEAIKAATERLKERMQARNR